MSTEPPDSSDGPPRPRGSHPFAPGQSADGSEPEFGAPGYPSQGHALYGGEPQGYQPQEYPQQGYPPPGYQPHGFAPQNFAPQSYPPPGYGPPGEPGWPQAYLAQPPLSVSDEKLCSTLSHISIPFFGPIGPLLVYLLFKDRGPFVRANAIESLNFSILYTLVQVVCWLLTAIIIGVILLPIAAVGALVLCILAAVAASRGVLYQYPVNWRLVK